MTMNAPQSTQAVDLSNMVRAVGLGTPILILLLLAMMVLPPAATGAGFTLYLQYCVIADGAVGGGVRLAAA